MNKEKNEKNGGFPPLKYVIDTINTKTNSKQREFSFKIPNTNIKNLLFNSDKSFIFNEDTSNNLDVLSEL